MKTLHPSYIVADIPEPICSKVMSLRRSCCGRTDTIPAEITLAGSSGVGPIPVGTEITLVRDVVTDILKDVDSFAVKFSEWKVFPNTTIAYLAPSSRQIFDFLHKRLANSKIIFSSIPFPYNPHCTVGSSWSAEALASISDIPFPKEPFIISSVRFLELDDRSLECRELAQFNLRNSTSGQDAPSNR